MPTFHSPATVAKTINAHPVNGTTPLTTPLTFTCPDMPAKVNIVTAPDGLSFTATCALPATPVPIPLSITAHAPVGGFTAVVGLTFDVDTSIVTGITFTE